MLKKVFGSHFTICGEFFLNELFQELWTFSPLEWFSLADTKASSGDDIASTVGSSCWEGEVETKNSLVSNKEIEYTQTM